MIINRTNRVGPRLTLAEQLSRNPKFRGRQLALDLEVRLPNGARQMVRASDYPDAKIMDITHALSSRAPEIELPEMVDIPGMPGKRIMRGEVTVGLFRQVMGKDAGLFVLRFLGSDYRVVNNPGIRFPDFTIRLVEDVTKQEVHQPNVAEKSVDRTAELGIEMVQIPGDSVAISKTPVTKATYAKFLFETCDHVPEYWREPGTNVPAIVASDAAAEAFAQWAGGRLPSTVEMIKADKTGVIETPTPKQIQDILTRGPDSVPPGNVTLSIAGPTIRITAGPMALFMGHMFHVATLA